MGRTGTVKPAVFDQIANRMTNGDPTARKTLRRWRAQRGFPRTDEVPIRDLVLASLDADENERTMYPAIREFLERQGWKELPAKSVMPSAVSAGPLTFDPDGDYGLRPDILMSRPKAKRLLVVEVKSSAVRPGATATRSTRSSTMQTRSGRRCLRQGSGDGGWSRCSWHRTSRSSSWAMHAKRAAQQASRRCDVKSGTGGSSHVSVAKAQVWTRPSKPRSTVRLGG